MHPGLRDVTPCNVTPSLYLTLYETKCSIPTPSSLIHYPPHIYIYIYIYYVAQTEVQLQREPKIQTPSHILWVMAQQTTKQFIPHTRTHHVVIYCHHRNAHFVLFHNIIVYINTLLSCIHINTAYLNITCTLVTIGMILGRL